MPQINEKCNFIAEADNIKFTTQTNGDIVIITGVHFDKEQAASLAWLINNTGKNLDVRIKLQE